MWCEMSGNGKTYTEVVIEIMDRMDQYEQRVIRRLDALNEKIEANGRTLSSVDRALGEHERRLCEHEQDIKNLENSDRRWGVTTGFMAVLGTIIASIVGTNK